MACGIYKITNLTNNHSYIGQSVDIKRRWRNEKSDAFRKDSSGYNSALSAAFRKYCTVKDGKPDFSNFSFEILEECKVSQLNTREQYYITKFNAYIDGYNSTVGGDSPTTQVLTSSVVLEIIEALRTSAKSTDQIGNDFGISGRMVRNINVGACHHIDSITYPIRTKITEALHSTRSRQSSKCPPKDILFEQLYTSSFTEVGKIYDVSATAVQKWLKQTGAPTSIKEFKAWYKVTILKETAPPKKEKQPVIKKRVQQFTLDGKFITEFPSL